MGILIGHASIGDRGARGNTPGDQTGKEVCIREWYNKKWTAVFRHTKQVYADRIATGMEQVCANPNIGYCQGHRTSMLKYAQECGYDYSKIKNPCEVDCSSLVGILCKGAGLNVSENIWTGNEKEALEYAGFKTFTTPDYTRSCEKLKRGDILLCPTHTAVVLQDGELFHDFVYDIDYAKQFDKEIAGKYEVCVNTFLSLRMGASVNKKEIAKMKNGCKLICYGYHTGEWYLVAKENGQTGFCHSRYLRKVR